MRFKRKFPAREELAYEEREALRAAEQEAPGERGLRFGAPKVVQERHEEEREAPGDAIAHEVASEAARHHERARPPVAAPLPALLVCLCL